MLFAKSDWQETDSSDGSDTAMLIGMALLVMALFCDSVARRPSPCPAPSSPSLPLHSCSEWTRSHKYYVFYRRGVKDIVFMSSKLYSGRPGFDTALAKILA